MVRKCEKDGCGCYMNLICNQLPPDDENFPEFDPMVLQQLAQQGGQQGLMFREKSDAKCLNVCKSDILRRECKGGFKCKVTCQQGDHFGPIY